MKISYAITVKDEFEEIKRLLPILLEGKQKIDEIVVLVDEPKTTLEIKTYLNGLKMSEYGRLGKDLLHVYYDNFNSHFADWKNLLTRHCKGDYIFQIDADEIPNIYLLSILPTVLESNQETEVYLVPRVNTVEGITQDHIQKWNWRIDNNNWINYPDYQWRIYKNNDNIRWVNKVHERLEGFKVYTMLPDKEDWSLYHPKTILKQEKQNNYYDTL
jgi:hypothetical protein